MIYLLIILLVAFSVYQQIVFVKFKRNTKNKMTKLEEALFQLVGDQQKELEMLKQDLENARNNQLKVAEDGDLIVVTYKSNIIYKATPTSTETP